MNSLLKLLHFKGKRVDAIKEFAVGQGKVGARVGPVDPPGDGLARLELGEFAEEEGELSSVEGEQFAADIRKHV